MTPTYIITKLIYYTDTRKSWTVVNYNFIFFDIKIETRNTAIIHN